MREKPETYITHDKIPFPVSGIWLRRIGDEVQVLFEHNGKWHMGIQEHVEGSFSHIMEPLGMRARVEKENNEHPHLLPEGDFEHKTNQQ